MTGFAPEAIWIVQWGGRVALGSEKNFAYITRFNTTCFERQLETVVRTERILYISHWFLLLFLLNLLLNAASVNVFRNVIQLKFAAILRNTRTVLRYLFLVIIYSIYFILLGPSIFILNAIFMIRKQSSLYLVQTPLYSALFPLFHFILYCTLSLSYKKTALWISSDK